MSRVLIIDDDENFSVLLEDIFTQSDYDVCTMRDPEEGFERFTQEEFDLVVTDQKMPALTGDQLIRKMKAVHAGVPIIMVSGYLDNETIRSLIHEGVGGVFLKPVNVFSLLKRAAYLIEQRERQLARKEVNGSDVVSVSDSVDPELGFTVRSLPCQSSRSVAFVKQLHSLRNFKSNLILVGEKGADIEGIISDLISFDTGVIDYFKRIQAGDFGVAAINEAAMEAQANRADRLTMVVTHPQMLTQDQKRAMFHATRAEGDFASLELAVRYIFPLPTDIDVLYDKGKISDDLYMFMGSTELRIPPLRDIREDIPLLAERLVREACMNFGFNQMATIDVRGKTFLREHEWPGNFRELKNFCTLLAELGKPEITRQDVSNIDHRLSLSRSSYGDFRLRDELRMRRDDYCRAVLQLCVNDPERTARLLGAEQELVDSIAAIIKK